MTIPTSNVMEAQKAKSPAAMEACVCCIDRSGSMNQMMRKAPVDAGDVWRDQGSRLDIVRQLFYAFRDSAERVSEQTQSRGGIHLGLVQFSQHSNVLSTCGPDLSNFESEIDRIRVDGTTNIVAALRDAHKDLCTTYGDSDGNSDSDDDDDDSSRTLKHIILLTDGESNVGKDLYPVVLVELLQSSTVVDAILVDKVHPDDELLQIVAATGGTAVRFREVETGMEVLESDFMPHVGSRATKNAPLKIPDGVIMNGKVNEDAAGEFLKSCKKCTVLTADDFVKMDLHHLRFGHTSNELTMGYNKPHPFRAELPSSETAQQADDHDTFDDGFDDGFDDEDSDGENCENGFTHEASFRKPALVAAELNNNPSSWHFSSSCPLPSRNRLRLLTECREIQKPNNKNVWTRSVVRAGAIRIFPLEEDLCFWRILMKGPESSPYAGGVFALSCIIPPNYPFAPPDIKFVTPVHHCQVGSNGRVCIPALHNDWSSNLTIASVLEIIYAMLESPNPDYALRQALAVETRTYLNARKVRERSGHANDQDTEKDTKYYTESVQRTKMWAMAFNDAKWLECFNAPSEEIATYTNGISEGAHKDLTKVLRQRLSAEDGAKKNATEPDARKRKGPERKRLSI